MTSNSTPAPIVPELLTPQQAAELLNIGQRTLWRYSRSGQAPRPIKIGAAKNAPVRYRRDVLLAWIDAGCPRVTKGGEYA